MIKVLYLRQTFLTFFALSALALSLLSGCSTANNEQVAYFEQAQLFFEKKQYVEAKKQLEKYLELDQDNPDVFYLLGQIAEKQADSPRAVSYYGRAITLKKDYVEAHLSTARLLLSFGKLDEAESMLNYVKTFRPQDTEVLTLDAALYDRRGDTANAIKITEQLVSENKSALDPLLLLNVLYGKTGDWQKGEALLRAALAANPNGSRLRITLATNLIKQDKQVEAETLLLSLIQDEPDVAPYQQRLAALYMDQSRLDDAESLLRKTIQRDPSDERRILVLAKFLAKARGKFTAEQELVAAIFTNTKSLNLRMALAELYDSMLNLDGAARVYGEVSSIAKKGSIADSARIRAARIYLRLGELVEAQTFINALLKDNPQNIDALFLRGHVSMVLRHFVSAIADFRHVLEVRPNSLEPLAMLVRVYVASGQSKLAEQGLRRAIAVEPSNMVVRVELVRMLAAQKRFGDALAEVEAFLQAIPENVNGLNLKVELLIATSEWGNAELIAASLSELYPDRVDGNLQLGNIYFIQKQYAKAIEAYKKALLKFPLDYDSLLSLSQSLRVKDGITAALQYMEAFLDTYPNHPTGYNILGELYVQENQHTGAEASFVKAYQLNPTWLEPYTNLAKLYMDRGENDAVIQVYLSGLSIIPDSISLAMLLAEAYEQFNKLDDAVETYEGILSSRPSMNLAARNLATLLVNNKDDKQSITRAIELAERFRGSKNEFYLDALGWVYYRAGLYEKSVSVMERVIAKSPNTPLINYHLGMAYFKQGEKDKAKTFLRKAVEARTLFVGYKDAEATLEKL